MDVEMKELTCLLCLTEDGLKVEPDAEVMLRLISKYLRIESESNLNGMLPLCEGCVDLFRRFSNLVVTLEKTKMELNDCVKSMQRIVKSVVEDKPEEEGNEWRQQLLENCSNHLKKSEPLVTLQRLPSTEAIPMVESIVKIEDSEDGHNTEAARAPEKNFECKTCAKGFIYNAVLTRHFQVEHSKRPFQCDLCGVKLRFSSISTARKHWAHCQMGKKVNISISKGNNHVKVVRPSLVTESDTFKLLLDTAAPPPPVITSKKDATTSMDVSLLQSSPLIKRGPFKCLLCKKLAQFSSQIEDHFRKIHLGKLHNCSICGCSFEVSSTSVAYEHLRQCRIMKRRRDQEAAKISTYLGSCTPVLPRPEAASINLTWTCKKCSESVTCSQLLAHAKSVQLIACDVCPAKFCLVESLVRHKIQMHPNRLHVSPVVSTLQGLITKPGQQGSVLYRLLQNQTSLGIQFACKLPEGCGKSFLDATQYNLHKMNCHPNAPNTSMEEDVEEFVLP